MPKKMGRPSKFDAKKLNELKALMRLNPTMKDAAAFFEVNPDTIDKLIKRHFNTTFSEFKEQNMVHTRLSLIRKAVQEATKEKPNTAMLIFALKNLCQWRDRNEDAPGSDDEERKIYLAYELRPKGTPAGAVNADHQLNS